LGHFTRGKRIFYGISRKKFFKGRGRGAKFAGWIGEGDNGTKQWQEIILYLELAFEGAGKGSAQKIVGIPKEIPTII